MKNEEEDPATGMHKAQEIEQSTQQMITATEDLLRLCRKLKELWAFHGGLLDTLDDQRMLGQVEKIESMVAQLAAARST